MPGDFRPICSKKILNHPEILKFIEDKQYRNATWGIFEVVRVFNNQKYLELSYYYKIGEPIERLRPMQVWDTVDDFYLSLCNHDLDSTEQIVLELRHKNVFLLLVLEPHRYIEEQQWIIYG